MGALIKQHLIDPEICIRCHACEEACPRDAITHNDDNVVVDAGICDAGGDCLGPCPTGAIDNWRMVATPYTLDEQFEWMDLPEELAHDVADEPVAAPVVSKKEVAPASAAKPVVNRYPPSRPIEAVVQGNFRLTAEGAETDIHHIVLGFEGADFPFLEGQSVGINPPGTNEKGRAHVARRYTISSPRDGERAGAGNISLTIRRIPGGVCSNYLCDIERGAKVKLHGPYGKTFLMPDDSQARLVMICTGTGAAPFRAFTMRHQRVMGDLTGRLHLFFGARSPDALPYHGRLQKVPDSFLAKHFAFSRIEGQPKRHVQDALRDEAEKLAAMLKDPNTYIYLCGLKAMEPGVGEALEEIATRAGLNWEALRNQMRAEGRYHVDTY